MKIVIFEPKKKKREIDTVGGTYVLGRSEGNDIVLDDNRISRKHAKMLLDPEKEKFVIEDLNSKNGVYVNEKRIKEKENINEGDIIEIGETRIELEGLIAEEVVEDVKVEVEDADATVVIKPPSMITLEKATKIYKLGKVEVPALKDVDLEVEEGEFISVCGPSGSGKSTLLNLLGCIDIPTSGKVSIMGKDVSEFSDAALSKLRNSTIGFIFQSFNLVPVLTAFENVEYPLVILGAPKSKRVEMAATALKEVGLSDFSKHKPEELSGGQRQRAAIARALVTEPKMVLADEPTANLDSVTGIEILDLMQKLNEEHKTTFIFSTHDPKIEKYAKKIYTMVDGRLSL
jgi:putative ABC transport system ATP-binding protein